jgi:hypothetical protein
MTAMVPRAWAEVDLVEAFTLRASAQAYLYAIGEISLHDAVDELQEDAEASGLIPEIGQDAIQQVMAEAVGHYRQ